MMKNINEHSNGVYRDPPIEISSNGNGSRNDLPFNLDGVNKIISLTPERGILSLSLCRHQEATQALAARPSTIFPPSIERRAVLEIQSLYAENREIDLLTVLQRLRDKNALSIEDEIILTQITGFQVFPPLLEQYLEMIDQSHHLTIGKPKVWIEFCNPSELKNYLPPENLILVGDCHIVRGSTFVIGGPPGIGKSRASVALGVAGATASDWFGLKIHRKFKTMILQCENGRFRLSNEFSAFNCDELDEWMKMSPPPPFGLSFDKREFRDALKKNLDQFKPDVFKIDPWNGAARDDKAKDYLETFELIRSLLPTGDDAPALGIVAHTRKPRSDERSTGRGLLNLLAGSYVLGSIPRSVFVMQPSSDDPQDDQVVWTCCKNNDGELGNRSVWARKNGLFTAIKDFDWESFDNPNAEKRTVTLNDLETVFESGTVSLAKARAVQRLEEFTQLKRTACYEALSLTGRFGSHLAENQGLISWKSG